MPDEQKPEGSEVGSAISVGATHGASEVTGALGIEHFPRLPVPFLFGTRRTVGKGKQQCGSNE